MHPPDLDFDYGTHNHGQEGIRPSLSHEGEHHSDYDANADIPIRRATKIFAMCAALNSCNLGFDIGVNTSAGKLLQDSSILEEVLRLTDARDENDAFTIHLVCR